MRNKIISVALVSLIMVLLVLSGPADAYEVKINASSDEAKVGDKITFTVELNSGESEEIKEIYLHFDGPKQKFCKWREDGEFIGDCQWMKMKEVTDQSYIYSYRYGYGYGGDKEIKYVIEVDTSELGKEGTYNTSIEIKSKTGETTTVDGSDIKLTRRHSSGGGSCWTTWECSNWSSCINGEQFRVCNKKVLNCPAEPEPELLRTCVVETPLQMDEEVIELNAKTKTRTPNQTAPIQLSVMTGAVAGLASPLKNPQHLNIAVLSFLIIICLIAIIHLAKSNHYFYV